MNTTRKGRINEARCRKALIRDGYEVWSPTWSTYQSKDMFNLFDIMAISPCRRYMRFIQVKSNRCRKQTREAIASFRMPSCCLKEIWVWVDYKGWKKFIYQPSEAPPFLREVLTTLVNKEVKND